MTRLKKVENDKHVQELDTAFRQSHLLAHERVIVQAGKPAGGLEQDA